MANKSIKAFIMLVVLVCLLSAQSAYAQNAAVNTDGDRDLNYLKSVMDMIKEKYKGDITDKKLIEGALKGMFGNMDPYTVYFNPEEANSFLGEIQGTYEGIGIMISKVGEYVTVVKVFSASPAEKAGIIPGDKIAQVNGKSVIGFSSEQVAGLVKGESGTKVTVGIIRNGGTAVRNIEVARAQIKINPVIYEIRNGIGYIKLDLFNLNADESITQALNEMDKKKIKKIILDLRNNPGGEVNQAVAVARKFVPEGLVTKLDFKAENEVDQEYYSTLTNLKYKLAVLVNGNSASASEILAGAIQDTKAGTLIGTKTFGKAMVQRLYPLLTPEAYEKYEKQLGVKLVNADELLSKYGIMPSNDEIMGYSKITIGQYTTPNGRMIDGKGIEPDIAVDDYALVTDIDINNIRKLTKTSKPDLYSEDMDVYNAEKILKALGYDVDTPDTKLDIKTFKAIDMFRRDFNLYPGGVLDFATQRALNGKLDKLILEIDKQYARAVEVLKRK